jgi:hypothetical protein
MSDDRHSRISEEAYKLWEKEGQPQGRHLDHWTEAERQLNEGEGNRTAARAYNRKTKEFAESGPVEKQAKQAKADLESPKGEELKKAEAKGRSKARGEDPQISRSDSR